MYIICIFWATRCFSEARWHTFTCVKLSTLCAYCGIQHCSFLLLHPPPRHKLESTGPLISSKFLCLNSHLSMVCLSCLGRMSRCIVRAYKGKCLYVKYTRHPVCPPLSVNKSLMHCLFFIVMCFKFVKFSPNVCMLVVLAVKLGHRNVSACRKKFKVNISVSNTTHSRATTIRLGIFKHTIQQEVSGGLLSQKILEAMRLPDCFFGAMWCFLEARHIYKYLPFVPIVAYSTAASSSSSPSSSPHKLRTILEDSMNHW